MDRFLDMLKDLFCNYLLISAVCAWFVAQIIKFSIGLFKKKKKSLKDFVFSMGGMPSSHSATMMGLTTAAALNVKDEIGASIFAVCAIFSIIVMRDAFGVRYQTGKQAKLLNNLLKKQNDEGAQNENDPQKNSQTEPAFDESVGHTPMQVVVGAIVGVAVGIALAFVFVF